MADDFVVSCSVVTKDPEVVVRSMESLARTAAGLALEGVSVSLSVGTVKDDD